MKHEELTIRCGMYIADLDYTLKETSETVGISLSMVYLLVTRYLPRINYPLYERCRNQLETHRHWGRGAKRRYENVSM